MSNLAVLEVRVLELSCSVCWAILSASSSMRRISAWRASRSSSSSFSSAGEVSVVVCLVSAGGGEELLIVEFGVCGVCVCLLEFIFGIFGELLEFAGTDVMMTE